MAEQKPALGKGNYIEYVDDAVKPDAKGNSANFLSYADEPTAKSGYVPKTELEKNNYAVYLDTPYEPGGETLPPNHVTVSLTNPVNASDFKWCNIYDSVNGSTDPTDGYVLGEQITSITSASGSATFDVDSDHFGFVVELMGAMQPDVFTNQISCTGDIAHGGNKEHVDGELVLFKVDGDGTVTLNRIDYGD
jgi:hypothetical protein